MLTPCHGGERIACVLSEWVDIVVVYLREGGGYATTCLDQACPASYFSTARTNPAACPRTAASQVRMAETRVLHRVSQKAFPRNRGIVSLLKMTSIERGNQ